VPDGELALIPFDILRQDPRSKDFGEDYAVSLSPSLSVSVRTRTEGAVSFSPILFFANNEYKGRNYQDGQVWADLNGTMDEIKGLQQVVIGNNLRHTTYLREEATAANIKQLSISSKLKEYPIIHFACHGYFNRENPVNSGLLLYLIPNEGNPENGNTGYLTIPDIALLDLDSKMVILSACETGLGEARIGEGMVGLVRAFMVAGAGNVGVSLWKISDTATISFMEKLYRQVLEEGKPFREAYKEVKEDFRGNRRFLRPYYWAAFTMYE
jgi:CHAT domain-containing protein